MNDSIDIARARRETPGCEQTLHFNNAGAALPPQPVVEAQRHHLQREAAIGGYEAAAEAHDALEHTYDALAALIGANREEIAVVENATRAWDAVFYAFPFEPGDRILTSTVEYASNFIAYLQVAERTGAVVDVVEGDATGALDLDALEHRLDDRVKLISLTHVPTNGGLVNPAAEVGRIAQAAGVPFLLDACQSVGQLPINVADLGCTFLSATGRKYLRGPRGTGFLYVDRSWIERLEPAMLDLHAAEWIAPDRYDIRSDARRFETWEGYVAGKRALGVAADYARSWAVTATWARLQRLAALLRERLADEPALTVRDLGTTQGGIVTFTHATLSASEIRDRLRAQGINVSVSPPSSTRIDADTRQLPDLVRASVHYYNTEAEVDRFVRAVAAL